MNIIDHLSVGVPSIDQAKAFYDAVLSTINVDCLASTENFAAYGTDSVQFLLMTPRDGQQNTAGNGAHVCFLAADQTSVDQFYSIALTQGGSDNGAPGPRPDYPKSDVYTAFVIDPFGNKLEVIHNGFNA